MNSNHVVTVYTMPRCPFCTMAKRLLESRGIEFQEILVPLDDDRQWDKLYQRSGMKTMPQIFAGDRLIGGFDDLSELDAQDSLASLKSLK